MSGPQSKSDEKPQGGSQGLTAGVPVLADLRRDIDRIDENMHALLMERSGIIDQLIAVKKGAETGSAFRPAREAEMMRRIATRHKGALPLDTVESIWRIIISTFTYVQAPFAVHADLSGGDAAMRDSARFHFGFTVPLVTHFSSATAIEAVTKSRGDLALVPAVTGSSAWWQSLEANGAPKIIARLPFIERANHPAETPVFIVSRAAADAVATEVAVYSLRVSGWNADVARAVSPLADIVAVADGAFDGAALIVSVPSGDRLELIQKTLRDAGATLRSTVQVGSHAARFSVNGKSAS